MKWSLVIVLMAAAAHADPKPDPCSAKELALGTAKPLKAWTPPAGCTAKGPGLATMFASEADVRATLTCQDPKAPLGVDFKTTGIVMVSGQWSPAMTGQLAFDDGKTVTLVSKQRKPCPNEPRPMPSPAISSAFLAAKGARTFSTSSCAYEVKCR